MRHSNINAPRPTDNKIMLDKDISLLNMEKYISKKISDKASSAKPLDKPPTRDKSLGIETGIRFYDIEDIYEDEK